MNSHKLPFCESRSDIKLALGEDLQTTPSWCYLFQPQPTPAGSQTASQWKPRTGQSRASQSGAPELIYICQLKSPAATCSSTCSQVFRLRDVSGRKTQRPARPIRPIREMFGGGLEVVTERQEVASDRAQVGDCNDDKRETARRLGLGLSSLYRKLEELGVRVG
jgi:hypothetical protein